jgi:multidrug transporter EmrE-like cation transporter
MFLAGRLKEIGAKMNPYWAMLAGAIITTMVGQALLKAGAGRADFASQLLDWRTLLGLGLYGGSAMLYIVALRRIPMSVALPCTAISYCAAAVIGHYAFGEPLGVLRIGAIGVISVGVIMLACA